MTGSGWVGWGVGGGRGGGGPSSMCVCARACVPPPTGGSPARTTAGPSEAVPIRLTKIKNNCNNKVLLHIIIIIIIIMFIIIMFIIIIIKLCVCACLWGGNMLPGEGDTYNRTNNFNNIWMKIVIMVK